MSERSRVVRGPWEGSTQAADAGLRPVSPENSGSSPRLVLAMVVRECAVALGHEPNARELANWANHQRDGRGDFCLFGREISAAEAAVILKNPDREVTVRQSRAAPKPGLGLVAIPGRLRE